METPQEQIIQESTTVEQAKDCVAVEVKEEEKPVENNTAESKDSKNEEKVDDKMECVTSENGIEEKNAEIKEEKKEEIKEEVKEEITEEVKEEIKEEVKEEKNEEIKEKNGEVVTKKEVDDKLLKKIKNQIEFYFGNVNLQRDRYLIEQTKLDDGWVPLSVLLTFKMLASMSKDVEIILQAVEGSELIEVSADKKKVRRSPSKPLPVYDDEYKKAQEARTIYIKGFPDNFDIDKVKTYFEENNLDNKEIENIVMRKYKKRKELFFKGSIFLQFTTLDAAKAYMARESTKYGTTDLIKMWSSEYAAAKAVEREERRQKKGTKDNAKNVDNKKDQSAKKEENKEESSYPKGSVLHLSGISENITREDFKECISELEGVVAFVDFKKGDPTGWVRLQGENAAQPILDKLEDNKLKVKDTAVECRLLKDEEEEQYLNKIKQDIANKRRKGGRDFSRGRGGRGQKRRHSPHRDNNGKRHIRG